MSSWVAMSALARVDPAREGVVKLVTALAPGVAFPAVVFGVAATEISFLGDVDRWPWQFFLIGAGGIVGTLAGFGDWIYHRCGLRRIPDREHRAELAALVCGVVLFTLMAFASVSRSPQSWLIPVIATVMTITALVSYDEFVFHRSCSRIERRLHHVLVFGNGGAWLAWAHWCFVDGGVHGM